MTPRSRRLAKALGESPDSLRRHAYSQENVDPTGPSSKSVPYRWQLSQLTRKLYEVAPVQSSTSAASNISSHPLMSLGASGLEEDFYARPASWSRKDVLAVILRGNIAFRCMHTQSVSKPMLGSSLQAVTCVNWSPDAKVLGFGEDVGCFRAYDFEAQRYVAEFDLDEAEDEMGVGDLSWKDPNTAVVAYQSGWMRIFDIRMEEGGKMTKIHKARACGIEWNSDGRFLASGGGDGSVVCWDVRAAKPLETMNPASSSSSDNDENDFPEFACRWRARKHLSTVKALAWCPWAPDLLASGGGTKDGVIHFWDAARGAQQPLRLATKAQVTSLHFAPGCREIVSTAGYPFTLAPNSGLDSRSGSGPRVLPAPRRHSVLVHSYPRGDLVGKIFDENHGRITHSCMSPDGTRLLTCGSDQSIRIYKVFGKQSEDVGLQEETMHSMSIIR